MSRAGRCSMVFSVAPGESVGCSGEPVQWILWEMCLWARCAAHLWSDDKEAVSELSRDESLVWEVLCS